MAKKGLIMDGVKLGFGLCVGKFIFNVCGNLLYDGCIKVMNKMPDDVVMNYQKSYSTIFGHYDRNIRKPMKYYKEKEKKIGF